MTDNLSSRKPKQVSVDQADGMQHQAKILVSRQGYSYIAIFPNAQAAHTIRSNLDQSVYHLTSHQDVKKSNACSSRWSDMQMDRSIDKIAYIAQQHISFDQKLRCRGLSDG